MREVRNHRVGWLSFLLVVGFSWAVWEMLVMPVSSGTAYPEYSTLRSDPRGSKALFDSLSRLPELTVLRNFKTSTPLSSGTTLLMLGLEPGGVADWTLDTWESYERLLSHGGRLVLAFRPATSRRSSQDKQTGKSKSGIEERLDLHVRFATENGDDSDPHTTALYFEAGPAWAVLRENQNGAVIVERPLQGGFIVLVADSFPFSNQSLAENPEPELLSRILGDAHRLEFDEKHLGIVESGSVATLGRKYRLELPLVMLLIAAMLYIWRSAASFLPPRSSAPDGAAEGRDSQAGLTALLRRTLPESKLMDACLDEWRRIAKPAALQKVADLDCSSGDVAAAYRSVYRTLRGKRD